MIAKWIDALGLKDRRELKRLRAELDEQAEYIVSLKVKSYHLFADLMAAQESRDQFRKALEDTLAAIEEMNAKLPGLKAED